MPLIKVRKNKNDETTRFKRIFYCPACEGNHLLKDEGRKVWKQTGSVKAPTITPDFNAKVLKDLATQHCHVRIEAGKLIYFDDCEHSFAGKTVPMVDFDSLEE